MVEVLEHMRQGIVLYDRGADGEDVVRFFNSHAAGMLELPEGFLRVGLRRREIVAFCVGRGDQGDDFSFGDHMGRIAGGEDVRVVARRPSGRHVLCLSFRRPHVDGSISVYQDISEKVEDERRLQEARAEYRVLTEMAPIGIVRVDAQGRAAFANTAALDLFDVPFEELDLAGQLLPAEGRTLGAMLMAGGRFEATVPTPYFARHVMVSVSKPTRACGDGSRVIAITDVTLLRDARARIEHMARHDPLTTLGNRELLNIVWQRIEARAAASPEPVHLVAFDLDRFKPVNDVHGHAVGDRLLQQVAARIVTVVGARGQSFRLGGDEFAVVFRDVSHEAAMALAADVVRLLGKPFTIGDIVVTIGCSAGMASFPRDGLTAQEIHRAADVALYEVKRNGRNGLACYDPRQEREQDERRRLEGDLALAVARNDFTLVFQPQIDLATNTIVGMEALLRWRNRRLDCPVPPAVFIPLAESSGLITLIDVFVVNTAIAALADFRAAGVEPPALSINLSPITLADDAIVDHLVQALRRNGVDPALVEIEITEGVPVSDLPRIAETLRAIRRAGMKVAIDDYGAGHNSIAYIQALPIDRLKLDRSIVRDIGREERARAIVASIHHLCDQLGIGLTAEGIETAEQWEGLRAIGPMDGQGYYLGYPDTAAVLTERLRCERAAGLQASAA